MSFKSNVKKKLVKGIVHVFPVLHEKVDKNKRRRH